MKLWQNVETHVLNLYEEVFQKLDCFNEFYVYISMSKLIISRFLWKQYIEIGLILVFSLFFILFNHACFLLIQKLMHIL